MIKYYCPHLFLLAIASLLLLLFTTVNCNTNYQMGRTLFEKRLTRKTTTNSLFDILNQENFNNDEEINVFVRDSVKPYPDRRSSFHAMRGKRRVISP
jgi:hypothetical protein